MILRQKLTKRCAYKNFITEREARKTSLIPGLVKLHHKVAIESNLMRQKTVKSLATKKYLVRSRNVLRIEGIAGYQKIIGSSS